MKTISQEEFKKKYGEVGLNKITSISPLKEKKEGYLSRVGSELKSSFEGGKTSIGRGAELLQTQGGIPQGVVRAGLGTAGATARAIFSPITAALEPIISAGLEKSGVLDNVTVMKNLTALDDWAKANPDTSANLMSILEIGGAVTGTKGLTKAIPLVKKGGLKTGELGIKVGEKGLELGKKATSKITKYVQPVPPTPIKAVGQVLQGKTKDIKSGVKGISGLDTTGVKTYSELGNKITNKITELAKKVDSDLGQDTTKRTLNKLNVKAKTTSGKTVRNNPVENALNQLDELYTKTGDVVKSANIKELTTIAKKVGLTNQEINDIARVYGSEFGSKAFSKLGDPLTSVNAQMFENTRKSLKGLARSGIKGTDAIKADKAMSSLYNTQLLVKKNIEAVNKITQKINERGLLEKIGHGIAKYGDILTGGTIRGLVGGLLPRGAGYKVMNALDIESALGKNLEIIQKAIKSKSDDEITKVLKEFDKSQSALKTSATKTTIPKKTNSPAKVGDKAKSIKNNKSSITNTTTKATTKSSLTQEAKKYKTADEFVDSHTQIFKGWESEKKIFF